MSKGDSAAMPGMSGDNNKVEVFRTVEFVPGKEYEFALYTTREGNWPNERYFTTNPLKYLGKYMYSKRFGGFGDGSRGSEHFIKDGLKVEVEYDYEGKTCFREAQRADGNGTREQATI